MEDDDWKSNLTAPPKDDRPQVCLVISCFFFFFFFFFLRVAVCVLLLD